MRKQLLVVPLLAIVACESSADKYDRLNREVLIAGLAVGNDERASQQGKPVCPELSDLPTNQYLSACNDSVVAHARRLALAQREMNSFMHR
ncbi:MAG: hypothetical protein ABR585_04940 [Gemmatimonadaceae bacterium]